ncbi:MAG TPA: response regulator transcription factor [Caldilineae bacterium]|nr:response regulator transcription factor [Caldilineae bacterium]
MTIRVLITDDQDIVRQGLSVILKHQPGMEVVGTAANGREAVRLVEQVRPDVVLMDLKMPEMNGVLATREIVSQHPEVKVVVLTTYDADEWVFDAIRAGASGYLLKDSTSEELVQAIQGAVAGEVRIDPAVAGKVLAEFNRLSGSRPALTQPHHPSRPDDVMAIETLTEREQAVLQEMAQGKSNKEIAEALFLAEGTVKNYVSVIISKLQANDRTQAAIIALKKGLATLE